MLLLMLGSCAAGAHMCEHMHEEESKPTRRSEILRAPGDPNIVLVKSPSAGPRALSTGR